MNITSLKPKTVHNTRSITIDYQTENIQAFTHTRLLCFITTASSQPSFIVAANVGTVLSLLLCHRDFSIDFHHVSNVGQCIFKTVAGRWA